MSTSWVPFYSSLREGDKRGLPRAVRFIYMELSLLARPFDGRLPLPRGFRSDLHAIHDVLGGDIREIKRAIELLTVPLNPDDPPEEALISIAGPQNHRVAVINAFRNWVKADKSTPRVRRHREKELQKNRSDDSLCNAFQDRYETVSETRSETPQRREEKRREEEREDPPIAPQGGQADPKSVDPVTPMALPSSAPPPSTAQPKREREPKGTRLPEDWQPQPETIAKFRREQRIDATKRIEIFKNHWLSSSKANAVKKDWDRAFAVWVQNDIDNGKCPRVADDPLPILRLPNRETLIPKAEDAPDFTGFSFGATK